MTLQELAEPGDLLFYRVTARSVFINYVVAVLERLLGRGRGDFGHVALLDADLTNKLESTWPKIRISEVDWKMPGLELWRIKDLTPDQANVMLTEARARVGGWYGIGKSLSTVLLLKRLEVCTNYIVECALIAGIDLGTRKGEPALSPDDLSLSPKLFKVI